MKTSAIVCTVLAGTFGITSLASAQEWRGDRRDHGPRGEQHQQQPRDEHRGQREHRGDQRGWQQPHHVYEQPRHVYQQPRYVYTRPAYRFYRGGYLPHEYRRPTYYVTNWQAYPTLYAPPYGYQWMNVDGNFLLVALATGLIANALIH